MLQQKSVVIRYFSSCPISRAACLLWVIIFISIIATNPLNAQSAEQISINKSAAKEMYDDGRYKTRSNSEEIAHYTKILHLDPGFGDAYLKRGFAQLQIGYDMLPSSEYISPDSYKSAIHDFTKAIKLTLEYSSCISNSYYGRGVALLGLGEYKKAIEDFNKAIELEDRSAYLYEQRGLAHQKMGDIHSAVADYMTAAKYNRSDENYTRVIKINHDFYEAYYQRGLIFLRQGYDHEDDGIRDDEYIAKDKAVEYLKRAVSDFNDVTRLRPDFFDAYFKRGLARVALGELQAGVEEANKVLRINSNSAQAYYHRGMSLHKLGKKNEAIENLSKAILLNREFADAYLQRGIIYAEIKNYQKAVEDFTRPIRIKKFDAILTERDNYNQDSKYNEEDINLFRNLLYNRAQSLIDLGDQQEALNDLNWLIDGLRIPFGMHEAYSLRGKIRSIIGDKRGAREDFDEITRYYLGQINRIDKESSEKKISKAFALIKKAKEINPNQPCIYYFSGNLYEEKGDNKEAIKEYEKSISLNRNIPDFYYARSIINRKLGYTDDLINDYSNLIKIGANLSESYKLRGDAYAELGYSEKAIEDYSKSIPLLIEGKYSYFYNVYCGKYLGYAYSLQLPSQQDAEYKLAEVYYNKGVLLAKKNNQEASQFFQNALDIFTKLGNEEWQQKVRIALESIK